MLELIEDIYMDPIIMRSYMVWWDTVRLTSLGIDKDEDEDEEMTTMTSQCGSNPMYQH